VLPAITSLSTTYGLVAFLNLTPVVKFTACSFGHFHLACSIVVFYRRNLVSFLPQSSAAHKTLNFSTQLIILPAEWHVGHCHSKVFSVLYGHCHSDVFCALYGHCHSKLFSAPYGHCHSASYLRSAVVMNVPSPRTASRQPDAAASHSCHFNTVLYPRSYSECQLPLNPVVAFEMVLFQSKIPAKFSQAQLYLPWHLCRPAKTPHVIHIFGTA